MKTVFLAATMFVLCLTNATGQGKLLASDPPTGLPLISATDPGKHIGNMSLQRTHKNARRPSLQKQDAGQFLFPLQH